MKLNAGFVVQDLDAAEQFYHQHFGFRTKFRNDFFLLLEAGDGGAEVSFLLNDHPSQAPIFKGAYAGQGGYLTVELPDVDAMHEKLSQAGLPIAVALRTEPWGDRHLAVVDPNGLAVDVVTYSAPEG